MKTRIYYSVHNAIEQIVQNRDVKADSGWGRLVLTMKDLLIKAGFQIVDLPTEANLEFYVGQPPFYLKPQLHPAVTLSMFETSQLPSLWAESFNKWDAVINPSSWGKQTFIDSGVTVPIHVLPLPIDFNKFAYCEHKVVDKWVYLISAVQLLDRKGIMRVAQLFRSGKMPADTELIIKTVPRKQQQVMEVQLCPQVKLIQCSLPFADYYKVLSSAHVSVNPSSGEGFGYLPAESMAVGLCTLMTNWSALEDLLNNDCTLPIEVSNVGPSQIFTTGGNDATIDEEDLLKKMLWTYEHQEESLQMGKSASQWIRNYCAEDKLVEHLDSIFNKLISTVPRTLNIRKQGEEGWIDWSSLERSLA